MQGIHETLVTDHIEHLKERGIKYLNIPDMMADVYGANLTVKPMTYPNYYPTLLLRLGCTLENGGKRCRRNGKNKTGWWAIP